MKRLITYSFFIMLLAVAFTSCEEKTTEDISRVTYFPEFNLKGDDPYFINVNNPPAAYEDPGAVVTEGGEEIEFESEANVDVDNLGYYAVSYSATNQDGYSATAQRSVVVGCPDDPEKTLNVADSAQSSFGFSYQISVEQTGIGKYTIDDITGFFNIAIRGEIGILCDSIVTGSSAYGMYQGATLDMENNQLLIDWSYPPLGYSGQTIIPIISFN